MPGSNNSSNNRTESEDSFVQVSTPTTHTMSASASSSAASFRSLTLHAGKRTYVRIPVPASPYEAWIAADALRDDFLRQLSSSTPAGEGEAAAVDDAGEGTDDQVGNDDGSNGQDAITIKEQRRIKDREAQILLTAQFMQYVCDKARTGSARSSAHSIAVSKHDLGVLQSTWAFFNAQFLHCIVPGSAAVNDRSSQSLIGSLASSVSNSSESTPTSESDDPLAAQLKRNAQVQEIHTLASKFDAESRDTVVRAYFEAFALLEKVAVSGDKDVPTPVLPTPKLFTLAEQGQATVFGIFGGQGSNEVYFDELQALFNVYRPLLSATVRAATKVLQALADEATAQGFAPFYTHGLDVHGWLTGSVPRPPVAYLASSPLSLPLIGLTQLLQYLVVCRAAGLTPGQFRERIRGATGHSQGVISAVVLSASGSHDQFATNVVKAVGLLFHIGKRGQEAFPSVTLEPALIADAVDGGEGVPTPMLSVTGLPQAALEAYICKTNTYLDEDKKVQISLFNGPRNFVVTGFPRSLFGLVSSLRTVRADDGVDQTRIPFSKRKPVFNARFLPISVPYHSSYLAGSTDLVLEKDYAGGASLWEPAELSVSVLHTENASDISKLPDGRALLKSICDQIFTQHIFWMRVVALSDDVTHCIDFGTGGLSGIGGLTARNLEGKGVRMLIPSGRHARSHELYSLANVEREVNWADAFAPKLVKTRSGALQIDTPMSRILGRPNIMVPGMTPSTVQAGFNVATLNAGYHIELAGGGHYNPKALRAKVAEIQRQVEPGQGLTLNCLYINQRQWGFQLPLWQEMRKEGLPLQGFCCAAGIPSAEKAKEAIDGLKSAGIEHISFKPGSVDGIRQVCNIAASNPDYPILMQWTGGRAGGHHSCEDFHQPILATYAMIRKYSNIILVAGSGFGSAEDFWPYLTGDWSVKEYGVQAMPFDGVLFGSWVMTAKEGHANDEVKELMVQAKGVEDTKWEGTFDKETGGVITVTSELGEPIHKIATRGIKLWHELDKVCFSLPKEKRLAWLADKKDYVIERLNADFQKPWFPQHLDGKPAQGVEEMTYEEVIRRMLRLLYISRCNRWVDPSLRNLMGDWLRRVEERFAGIETAGKKVSMIQSYTELDKQPEQLVRKFLTEYSDAQYTLLSAEDVAFFLAICNRPGQKPVPFIPVLDENFSIYFKKDSLSYAEDLDSVFDRDPQRVAILHGPVAARHNTRANVPIKEMLGTVESTLVKLLLERYYGNDESKVPVVDYLGKSPLSVNMPDLCAQYGIKALARDNTSIFKLGEQRVPDAKTWLEALAGPESSWLRALLTSVSVVQGKNYINNPIARVFAPRAGQVVEVTRDTQGQPTKVCLFGAHRSYGKTDAGFKAVEVKRSGNQIEVQLFEYRSGEALPLPFVFHYHPERPYALIHEEVAARNENIKRFYWKLWFFQDMPSVETLTARKEHHSPSKTLDAAAVKKFCQIVGNSNASFQSGGFAPMDFAIVAGWEAIMQALMASCDADLLSLVHLNNSFKTVQDSKPLRVGDVCSATASVQSVKISDTGKSVAVEGVVLRQEADKMVPVIKVVSSFFFRGRFTDFDTCFENSSDRFSFEVKTKADAAVLLAKEWFSWTAPTPLQPGTTLHFHVDSVNRFKDSISFSAVQATGGVYVKDYKDDLIQVGEVDYEAESVSYGNPVVEYIKRAGGSSQGPVPVENGYSLITPDSPAAFAAPATNEPYSMTSGDFNPIHVNPYFADFASLPGTITHGLFSSAATRKYVEDVAAEGHPERCLSFQANFTGMVLPGDKLEVRLRHTAMHAGNKVVKVETFNQHGEKVLDGQAEIAQPPTVYVFTGQGSQEQGMGQDLYNSSVTAKALWDEADNHLRSTMGFSILEIVNQNPLTKTVHFGGVRGHGIRDRYMSMAYEATDENGNVNTLPLFPEITKSSQSYTFHSPNGLLFATQFAQIALVLVELSAFQDMKQRGLIKSDAAFAGHSLGEYASLAAVAAVLQVKDLVDVVFYRGLTMQRAVKRDAQGRSDYGMMACNPTRIGPSFSDGAFGEVVDTIGRVSGRLIQTVNFNVSGQQMVIAGELITLLTMTNVLNYIKIQKIDLKRLQEIMSIEEVKEKLEMIVTEIYSNAQEEAKKGPIQLQRGFATIPLPGIDVPFHSQYLTGGVAPFRSYLSKRINMEGMSPNLLINRYIPNLIAKPFELSKSYAEIIFNQTDSPRLDRVLKNWDRDGWGTPEREQRLTTTLVVELLAYQFASPVQWIRTQELLFGEPYNFERFVEFGPSPTLVGMAQRTHKAFYKSSDEARGKRRVMLCTSKDKEALYYAFADAEPEADVAPASNDAPAAAPSAAAPAPAPTPAQAAPSSVGGTAANVPDEPLKAVDTLRAILSQKLKKPIAEISPSKSVKDMVGGKSTMQNEIVSSLIEEFATVPERGEELPVEELGAALNMGYSGTLGKYTSGLVSRLVGSKLPGGFNLSSLKSHLNKAWGLGPSRTDGVLLIAITQEPAKRLGSEPEAKAWLDSLVQAYASTAGISLNQGGSGGGGGGGGGAAISSEELDKLRAQEHEHARRQIQILQRYLGEDGKAGGREAAAVRGELQAAQAQLDAISTEHGELYTNGIKPRFDARKVRTFSSHWSWSRQQALTLYYDIIKGRLGLEEGRLQLVKQD
ncbi:hypothetical protein K437DRAFT_273590 [Tilletiaria anomala UBC 951]|uniref:Carrier domain-containing protein n=1 Tax=Tilletiaria anomala (strain ATCC 24038 / CBS 436.72 / UBC 951) TaxID=1037660 RepID=A0A066W186_TILAU|nr:uncharacterized protein K437DRAFT_273590 [Tilletiaria anomala UBC 951]KDN47732.1 hypothetical protein K437DRAFT_273590 [Tilletiaria anomala UBC 951]